MSQSLGAKTRAACWQILLIQRRWNEREKERGRWEGEGEEKQMEERGGLCKWVRKRARESTHTPLSALSADRLILTWLEWVCCGVVIDKRHGDVQDYSQYLEETLPVWTELEDSNSWCLDTLLRNKNEPRIYLWGMPHYQLYFHAVLLSPKCLCNWTFMSVCWTISGSPGTVLEWTADSDKCHTAWLIRFTRHRGFKSLCCVPLLDNQYAECI